MDKQEQAKAEWLQENAMFGLSEEIRMMSSKMEVMYNEICSSLPLVEEMQTRIKTLDKTLAKLKEIRAEIRKDARKSKPSYKRGEYKCRKKDEAQAASTTSCGALETKQESRRGFLKKWLDWPEI